MTTAWPLLLCLLQAPVWDVKPRAQQLAKDVADLRPMVELIRVDRWQGPEAGRFETRKQSALTLIGQVRESAEALAATPDRLQVSMELLTRFDSLLLELSALSFGVSRYQGPAMADAAHAVVERLGAQRDSLRQYVEELTASRESDYTVVSKEAQRCREQIVRPAAPKKQNQP